MTFLTWQQIHDLYHALVSIDIILFIILGIALIVGYWNEPKVVAFEQRLWKRIKCAVRRLLLRRKRIREWARREDPKGSRVILPNHPNCPHTFIPWYGDEPDDDYKVDDKIYRVRR